MYVENKKRMILMNMFEIKNNNLYFGDCNTIDLVNQYGTPLNIISEEVIEKKCKEINNDFLNKHSNVEAFYASKAFLNLSMCKIIDGLGLGLDVVSSGELYIAMRANFPPNRIIFHGNNKSKKELKMAINYNIKRIIVDNHYELELLQQLTDQLKKKVKILFRVNPRVAGKTHEYITTGQEDSKFGIPIRNNRLEISLKQALTSDYIELMGFHFHIGSQLLDNKSHLKAIEVMFELMKKFKEKYNYDTLELNTGGGYGIQYRNMPKTIDLIDFTDPIMEKVQHLSKKNDIIRPKIIIEPGRWIIGQAGITLYEIGSIKEIPGIRKYVAVDGGMTDNLRPALYDANYEGIIANKASDEIQEEVTIAGKCCESGDILIWDLEVPRIKSGDILAILSTGAYSYSMASNYNKLLKPAVVLVNKGDSNLIVKRETNKDLIHNQLIPDRLKKK